MLEVTEWVNLADYSTIKVFHGSPESCSLELELKADALKPNKDLNASFG